MAEDPALSPWPAMNEERFDADTTCVMVLKAEAPHNVLDIGSASGAALLEIVVDCCTTLGSTVWATCSTEPAGAAGAGAPAGGADESTEVPAPADAASYPTAPPTPPARSTSTTTA